MSFATATITTTRPAATDGLGRASGSATSVFSGKADVQEQTITSRTQDGTVYDLGQAQAFPEGEPSSTWLDQQKGDTVAVTFSDGTTQDAIISDGPRRLDGRMVLRYTDS